MQIIDLHCDTIMLLREGKHLDGLEGSHINTDKLFKGGVLAQCFAIFVPTHDAATRHGVEDNAEKYVEEAYAAYKRELALNSDRLLPALTADDILRNAAAGKVSAVLTVEDCVTMRGKLSMVDTYFDMGVRMAALTWNYENSLGYPNSFDERAHGLGLKPFGKEAVARMFERGIIPDVSHLNAGGFFDVADIAQEAHKPFVASHSCARALCDHRRNLTDAQLRTLADCGGVVGLNYATDFLKDIGDAAPADAPTTCDDIIRHMKHIENVAGIDALAMGSDYDGIDSVLEWGDCGGSGIVLDALGKVFTPAEIDKITHLNALRVFRDVIG